MRKRDGENERKVEREMKNDKIEKGMWQEGKVKITFKFSMKRKKNSVTPFKQKVRCLNFIFQS